MFQYGTVSIVLVGDCIYCVSMGQYLFCQYGTVSNISVWGSILMCQYGTVSIMSVWASIYCDNVYHNTIHYGSIHLSGSKCLTESNSDSNNSNSNSL